MTGNGTQCIIGGALQLIVREAELHDIESMVRIKFEPLVASFQYGANRGVYTDFLRRVLHGENQTEDIATRLSAIELENAVVGYVRHEHYGTGTVKMIYCSWNLASTLWGRGIMTRALTELINSWMRDNDTQHVFADHFHRNERCRRLLNRLGFGTQRISFSERLLTVFQQRSLQWVVRRRLDATQWNASAR